jgi:hypothetical protein
MNQKTCSGLLSNFRLGVILPGLALLTAFGLFFSSPFGLTNPQDPNAEKRPTIQPPSSSPTPEAPANWKSFSENRSNVDFSFRYSQDWDDPFEHCKIPPSSRGFGLSPKCLKVVIITEDLPDESALPGRDIVLSSTTQKVVNGFNAKRKLYTLEGDPLNTPDTYELWIYDNGQPIMLLVAWIGEGTDLKTANDFVQHLDRMVNTLQLRRR